MAEGYSRSFETGSDALPDDDSTNLAASTQQTPSRIQCPAHPDRIIELYCASHDMVYCALCVAMEHRTCTNVTLVTNVSNINFDKYHLQTLITTINNTRVSLREAIPRKHQQIAGLEEEGGKVIEEIETVHGRLVQHIASLKEKVVNDVMTNGTKIVSHVKSEISQMDTILRYLQKYKDIIATSRSMTNTEEFIYQKLVGKPIAAAENLVTDRNYSKLIAFTPDKTFTEAILSTTASGQVGQEVKSVVVKRKEVPTARKVVQIIVSDRSSEMDCGITGICQLADGTIILSDYVNKKLKRLDDQYQVNDTLSLESNPWGVCCIGPNQVVVKLDNGNIAFVSVGVKLSINKTVKTYSKEHENIGIEYCFSRFWVGTSEGQIHLYDTSGSRRKTIFSIYSRDRQTLAIHQISVNNDKTSVCVATGGDRIQCVDTDGAHNIMQAMQDKRLKDVRGVCVSNHSIIFATGYRSNNIIMFRKDGTCLGELLTADGGLMNPRAVCYDKKKDCLVVASRGPNTITLVELEY